MLADVAGVRASLDATFSSDCASPRVTASPALQLRGPFHTLDALPLYLLKNVTAGVFAEDQYNVTLSATTGARAHVSTSSATKVHTMPRGHAVSRLTMHAAPGSCLVYDPAPTILQAGSDLHQITHVITEPGSTVIVSDIVVFGRLARGEQFAFRRFSNELTLSRADDEPPYYIQRFVTSPEDPLTIEDSLRGYGVLGTLIAALPNAATGIDRIRQAFAASNDCYAGASLLPGDGVIIQVLSSRADAARRVLHAAQYAILGAADD